MKTLIKSLKNIPMPNLLIFLSSTIGFFTVLYFWQRITFGWIIVAFHVLPWVALYCVVGIFLLRFFPKRQDAFLYASSMVLLACIIMVRVSLTLYRSGDYDSFLEIWVKKIRLYNGFSVLGKSIGNYNVPYYYILCAIAKITKTQDLLLIKFVSILFEFLCAYYVYRLVSLLTNQRRYQIASIFGVLLIPSLVLNGAAWAQCDIIFTCFGIAGLYYGIRSKSKLCFLMFSLAFAFKLQAVFFLPMLLVFLIKRSIKWRDIWVFPVAYVALLLPAIFAGRTLHDVLSVYFGQMGEASLLQLTCPSIYGFFEKTAVIPTLVDAGVFFAGIFVIILLSYVYLRRERIGERELIEIMFLFTLIIPFLLPHMHERYFFSADVVSFLYLFLYPKRWFVPLTMTSISCICYIPYLYYQTIPLPISVLSTALLFLIGYVLSKFVTAVEGSQSALS